MGSEQYDEEEDDDPLARAGDVDHRAIAFMDGRLLLQRGQFVPQRPPFRDAQRVSIHGQDPLHPIGKVQQVLLLDDRKCP